MPETEDSRWTTEYLPQMQEEADPERLALIAGRLVAAVDKDLSPRRQATKDLADATRELIGRLVATDAPDDVIRAATDEIRGTLARFEGYSQGSLYGFSEAANVGDREDPLFDHSPMLGLANPLAPPLAFREVGGSIVADAHFGQAYEGPPGCVHGGFVAAAFDEVLGAAQSLSGAPGMTGTLSVRYESPTPLLTDLRFEGRLAGVERRKIFVEGTCHAGDRLTATATGIFISLQPGRFMDLLSERDSRQSEQR